MNYKVVLMKTYLDELKMKRKMLEVDYEVFKTRDHGNSAMITIGKLASIDECIERLEIILK